MKYLLLSLLFFSLFLLPSSSLSAAVPNDFDGDGLSDFVTTSAVATIAWKGQATLTDTTSTLEQQLGVAGDVPAPGYWLNSETPSVAVIQQDTASDGYLWKVAVSENEIKRVTFGKSEDLPIIGGDFDGDGLTDGAVVRTDGEKLVWYIRLRMFSNHPKTVKIELGKVGDRAFFVNPDGARDWIAVVGKNSKEKVEIQLADVKSSHGRKRRTIKNLPSLFVATPKPRPFPVASGNGGDYIGVLSSDRSDTTLRVYSLKGKKVAQITFVGLGAVAVGEYDAEYLGEEIAFQSGSKITVFNKNAPDRIIESETLSADPLIGRMSAAIPVASGS